MSIDGCFSRKKHDQNAQSILLKRASRASTLFIANLNKRYGTHFINLGTRIRARELSIIDPSIDPNAISGYRTLAQNKAEFGLESKNKQSQAVRWDPLLHRSHLYKTLLPLFSFFQLRGAVLHSSGA